MILKELIENQIFLSTFFSVCLAQIVKTFLDYRRSGHFHWQSLFRGAGMPSSHTATVVSLALSTFLVEGITNLFIVSFVLAGIVVRDVIGDKIFATHQENIINKVVQQLVNQEKVTWNHLIGHTITEVIAGATISIIVTLLVIFVF